MLSSYRVKCPHEACGWGGSLVPSLVQGGTTSELAYKQRAWFRCPSCSADWEVRISGDSAITLPAGTRGSGPSRRNDSVPLASIPATQACPVCQATNSTAGVKTLQVEMRPMLTAEVFAFPDALAEVNCLRCEQCGHWICLEYRIELDDNPEIDLNPE